MMTPNADQTVREIAVPFPYVPRLEAAVREGRPSPGSPFGTIANPIAIMMAEQNNAGELLERSAVEGCDGGR
jgi:hypothetical protein